MILPQVQPYFGTNAQTPAMPYLGVATAGGGMNAYAAGPKIYGTGSLSPTVGPVDNSGYQVRDLEYAARRNAMLQQMMKSQQGNYMSAPVLGGPSVRS
jgi:hypothetical protein